MNNSRIALVTGAGKGIGKAVAIMLAKKDFFVFINYLSDEKAAQNTLKKIRALNKQAKLLQFDVSSFEESNDAVNKIINEKSKIDILVNNSGIKEDGLFVMMSEQSWQKVIKTNLTGFYNITKPVVKNMLKNRYGRIVNVTSTAGQIGNPGQVNYSASKAGIIGATKALAKEVGSRNINVNAVSPGFIDTQMLAKTIAKDKKIFDVIPSKRPGTPEEVAYAIAFLCSEKASYINGQVLGVNGGMF